MIGTITFSAVVLYVGDKILEHYIQNEIWEKRIWHRIFPPKTFRSELYKTINETIDEYELSHTYHKDGTQFPFYHSKILIDILSNHILFNKTQTYSIEDIQAECEKNSNIIYPSQKNLDDFYSLFVSKIESNKALEKLFINENYKSRIYEISGTTNIILEILLKTELTPDIVFNKLKEQTQFQIDKQKKSGKYIPETFIETNELKDHIRYFVAPFLFIDKVYDEIKKMRFNHLKRKLKLRKKNDKFDFNITDFPLEEIKKSHNSFDSFVNYINEKHNALEEMGYNETWATSRKVKQKVEDLEYIVSKVIILKDNAGQGKTNLLCDVAENVLLKRAIPALFLTGYELDAGDIYSSIVKRLFPNKNYTFNDVISRAETYCKEKNTFFVILFDGLNENPNPQMLSQNLELFITDVLKYKHIRIILSCRTEYYKNNFANLSNASFKESLIQVNYINNHLDECHKKRLYETYLSYFQITINEISKEVYEQLVDNFLLLRIFSEAYKNTIIPSLLHIYKDELFQKYYDTECKAINQRLSNDEFPNNVDIANFFRLMIKYMIENTCYENIPLDDILSKDAQNKKLYIRFLDENILVRKDLDNQNGVFGNSEFVNFTFDEFRDFLITDYLLRELCPNNQQIFEDFVSKNINNKSKITEGCMSFLFSMERKMNDKNLSIFIRKQNWYQDVFPYYIFDIQDNYVTDEDKQRLKQLFLSDINIIEQITLALAYRRWNKTLFQNLNIELLFEIFNELNNEQFKNIYSIYPMQGISYTKTKYDWKHKDLEMLIEKLDEYFEQTDFTEQPDRHNLFLYILYFMPISNNVKYLYKRYWDKYKFKEHFEFILNCKSSMIKQHIIDFMNNYEIQL
ncbi:hypothetical protein FACS189413_07220 [Bacteroidia bacterium]|nr:hypothetical protein FACS189413_07220 [Bacteroidia bacterium]